MAIEDQHDLRTPLMPQVHPLHKDPCLRAKLVHGAIFKQHRFITRNDGYIWRMRSYDYVICAAHLLYDLLEKCSSGRLGVSGRLRNTAADALVAQKLCISNWMAHLNVPNRDSCHDDGGNIRGRGVQCNKVDNECAVHHAYKFGDQFHK